MYLLETIIFGLKNRHENDTLSCFFHLCTKFKHFNNYINYLYVKYMCICIKCRLL